MPNSIAKITGYVVREAARGFYNDRLFSGLITNSYSNEFAENGAQKGNQIFVKLPAQYNIRVGSTMQNQDVVERKIPVTLGEPVGVDFQFSATEVTLDIDNNKTAYAKNYINPAGSRLASHCDAEGMEAMALATNNTIVTAATPTLKNFLNAKALLNKNLAPKKISERFAVIGSDVETSIVDEVKVLYNSASEISRAIKDGSVQAMGGLNFSTSDLAFVRTNGAGGAAGLVVGSYTEGEGSIVITGATAAGIAVGDVIEFDTARSVNPETKKPYANKLQRTVLALGATDTLTIDPIVGPQAVTAGGIQNASAVPLAAATVSVLGVSGTDYLVSLVFHKEAYDITAVDLVLPTKAEMADRIKVSNMSIRFVKDYIINSNVFPNRLDIMYTYTAIHKEWGVRVETPLA